MPPQTRHKVLVADREPARRSVTRQALEAGGMTVCAEARDARSAVAAALREPPSSMSTESRQRSGRIFATREIRRRLPETAVVVTGGATHLDDAFGALYAGAAGFLPDEMNAERMVRALRGVLSGEAALPRRLVARLIEEFRHQGKRARLAHALRARGIELTQRQWDVLELLAEGLTTAQIAAILSIAEATVRSHVATVLRKLRVSTRAGAADLLQGAFRSLNAQ